MKPDHIKRCVVLLYGSLPRFAKTIGVDNGTPGKVIFDKAKSARTKEAIDAAIDQIPDEVKEFITTLD